MQALVQWMQRHEDGLDRAAAEKRTLAYMGTMPAWKNHPKVKGQA